MTVPERGRDYRQRRARMVKASPWCVYCGIHVREDVPNGHPEKATIDHIQAEARGGRIDASNEAVACWSCNSRKGARVLSGPDPNASRVWL